MYLQLSLYRLPSVIRNLYGLVYENFSPNNHDFEPKILNNLVHRHTDYHN